MHPPVSRQSPFGSVLRSTTGVVPSQQRERTFGDVPRAWCPLLRERGNLFPWIGIRARGRKSNRDGIGARVKVVSASGLTQYYTVNTAVGYLSASDKRLIVGLGADKIAKLVEIRWPAGGTQRFENVPAGKMMEAVEP
jgi:hypothetical protein